MTQAVVETNSSDNRDRHWAKTRRLMYLVLAIWFAAGFVVHAFVHTLNQVTFLGFPLGFYMAAQGSLIIFVVLVFAFAHKQSAIDSEFGFDDDEGGTV